MHDLSGPGISLAVAILKVAIAFAVGVGAVTLGIRLFGKWTKNLDEIQELRRGNVAVGVLMAAVVLAYTLVLGSGLAQVTDGVVDPGYTTAQRVWNFVGGLVNLAIAVTVASLTIRYALLAFEKVAKGIDQATELRNRNVAVAFLLAGIIYGISQVTSRGLDAVGQGVGNVLNGLFHGLF